MSRNLLLKVVTFLLKAPNLGRLWIIHVWIIRPTKTRHSKSNVRKTNSIELNRAQSVD